MDTRVDEYLDGELSGAESASLLSDAASDPALRADLERAVLLRDALRSMPHHECPPEVVVRAHAAAKQRRTDRAARPALRRSGVAVAALLGAAILLIVAVRPTLPEPEPQPTQAEVQQALDDVQLAFALIADAGRRTGRTVREEIIPETRALEIARRPLSNDNLLPDE